MAQLTGRQRIGRILRREPVDRIGLFEHFWGDTQKKWTAEGHLRQGEDLAGHFGFDMSLSWTFNMVVDLDFEPVIVEETEETVLTRDGNGALLRRHKLHDATPEHVDFLVKERAAWEDRAKPLLKPERRRIDFAAYRAARDAAQRAERFFCWSGVNVFEIIKDVTGHEHMLVGMALDPDWVRDMVNTYAELTVALLEMLFAAEGEPDGIWFYEDMGFKAKPFMSPAMYRDIVWPAHKRTFDFGHSKGLPIILHSCGYVEPLVPGLIEAGMDCLQAMEVKAGMDLVKLKRQYGDRIAFMGGIDIRALESNDPQRVEAELQAKVPIAMEGGGYCLHTDHSVSSRVEYDTYRFFVDRGLEIGTYKKGDGSLL